MSLTLADTTIATFAARLASGEPVPGGGSVAALTGLTGICLLEMVINLSVGRAEFAPVEAELRSRQAALADMHRQALSLIDQDAAAFTAVMAALRMPQGTEEEKKRRQEARQAAFRQAAEIPLALARVCLEALEMAQWLPGRTNKNAASDLYVGAVLLQAASHGALANTAANLPWLQDEAYVAETRREAIRLRAAVDRLAAAVKNAVVLPL